MFADEDSQFHLDPSPKKRLKMKKQQKKQNLCIICQKKGNNLLSATETDKNTFLMHVNRTENDVCRRLNDSGTLERKNVTLR